jgi:hypothetical protein
MAIRGNGGISLAICRTARIDVRIGLLFDEDQGMAWGCRGGGRGRGYGQHRLVLLSFVESFPLIVLLLASQQGFFLASRT